VAAPLNKQAEVSVELVEDWEDLVIDPCDDWEKVADAFCMSIVPVDIPKEEEEEEDLTNHDPWGLNDHYKRVRARAEQSVVQPSQRRILTKKSWKGVNRCKEELDPLKIIMMIYERGMVNRWNKGYRRRFPTWHAVGKKWQGTINTFVGDIKGAIRRSKEYQGGFEADFWQDGIITVVKRVMPDILKRHHPHTVQILKSMIEDSRKLDWGIEGLHAGLVWG